MIYNLNNCQIFSTIYCKGSAVWLNKSEIFLKMSVDMNEIPNSKLDIDKILKNIDDSQKTSELMAFGKN